MRASVGRAVLIGTVVASLWMFPLLNGLTSRPVWLQWTRFDSLETLATWAVGAGVIGLTLWLPLRAGWSRLSDAICAGWLLLAGLMATGAVVKVRAVMGFFDAYRSTAPLVVGAFILLLCATACLVVRFPGTGEVSRLQRATTVGWPLALLFLYHMWNGPAVAAAQRAEFTPAPVQSSAPAAARSPSAPGGPRTVVLLFDELSVDYVYGDRAIDLQPYPALARLRAQATLHRDAHLQGGATRYAIPALFGVLPEAPQGLVRALVDSGRSVRIWGWYHDYCVGLALAAQVCHSDSLYNARTLHDGISLLDPLWTNFNLLPAERPFGLVKMPLAIKLHRDTLDDARQWLRRQLADPAADFIYVHVNVPHVPFLDGDDQHPFQLSETGYLQQFGRIDAVVADALASATRPTRLVVLSDHNARTLFPKAQHDHVVFMVLEPGARAAEVNEREDAARALAQLALASPSP